VADVPDTFHAFPASNCERSKPEPEIVIVVLEDITAVDAKIVGDGGAMLINLATGTATFDLTSSL
jgi:hypothetical protein